MLVSGQWFDEINVEDFAFVKEKILSMDAKERSYLFMEDANGDYIQIGGYSDRFSVEVRINKTDGGFIHYKADTSPIETIGDEIVLIGGQNVNVRPTQVLKGDIAVSLF